MYSILLVCSLDRHNIYRGGGGAIIIWRRDGCLIKHAVELVFTEAYSGIPHSDQQDGGLYWVATPRVFPKSSGENFHQ